jgi:hypothetical protein
MISAKCTTNICLQFIDSERHVTACMISQIDLISNHEALQMGQMICAGGMCIDDLFRSFGMCASGVEPSAAPCGTEVTPYCKFTPQRAPVGAFNVNRDAIISP